MKKIVRNVIVVALISSSSNAFADTSLGKFKLDPGQTKTITLPSKAPLTVGFTTDISIEIAQSCKHFCIKMTPKGDSGFSAAAAMGTSEEVKPVDGAIEVAFENVEAFPIPIEIFKK